MRSVNPFPHLIAIATLFIVLSGPIFSSTAVAQTKPFWIVGVGEGPMGLPLPGQAPRSHWSVGDAAYLGPHTGRGSLKTDTAVPDLANGLITGEFGSSSKFVFSGLHGDKLVCNYGRTDLGASQPGEFELTILDIHPDGSLLVKAQFIAEFVAVPSASTGKFAGVTGSWVMYAWTAPFVLGSSDPVYYAWEGEGRLTFKKK